MQVARQMVVSDDPATDSQSDEVYIKVVVLGEEGTGKTCICQTLADNSSFSVEYFPTHGLDVYEHKIEIGSLSFMES